MGKLVKLSLLLLMSLALTLPVAAQEVVAESNLPSSVMLEGLVYQHQDTNRCSAAALSMHLSYFEADASTLYVDSIRQLNPYGADASVRIEEMARAAEERGYGAIVRRGGDVDLLRRLIAAGLPVLVENVYYDGPDGWNDWLSHNRVAVGYDDQRRVFSFYDPLLGWQPNGYKIVEYGYDEIMERWKPFNHDYLVIYRPEEEAKVQAVLGDMWDLDANAQHVAERAQAEIDAGTADSFTYFNLGWAQLTLGDGEAAAASYDTARSIGLPWRMLWYEFGPFEAYLEVGRYQDVISLANTNINQAGDTISVEEWYYYAGLAYEGLGNIERALLNYDVALYRNSRFTEVAERITALRG